MKDDNEKFFEQLAQYISSDREASKEFLKSEGIDYNEHTESSRQQLKEYIAKYKLAKGRSVQNKLKRKFEKFLGKIESLSLEEVQEKYPGIPATAFSKLERKEISEEEKNSMMQDASFLSFLEYEFNNDTKED